MSYTDGAWEQGSPNTDLQIFIGATQLIDFAAVATLPAAPAAGLLYKVVPATDAAKFFASISALLRKGQYASPARSQEQFGTAAAEPGPSLVANTSGPLALTPGYPPITAADMATVGGTVGGAGIQRGPIPKGLQINSVDVIYQVLALAAAAVTFGLTTTDFSNLVAPVVSNIIALGAHSLPTAIGAEPQVTNIPVPSPAMIVPPTGDDRELIANLNITAGGTGTVNVYGIVLNCSYNLN